MPSSASITRMYRFSGRVQGVGFRWTTRGIADRFSVSGYVKNLSDGRVEMVAQGQEAVVTEFANAVTARFEHNLDLTECLEGHPEEKLTGFVIRR